MEDLKFKKTMEKRYIKTNGTFVPPICTTPERDESHDANSIVKEMSLSQLPLPPQSWLDIES